MNAINSPIVKAITLAVLKQFYLAEKSYEIKQVINSELVPKISKSLRPKMRESIIHTQQISFRPQPPKQVLVKPTIRTQPRQPITKPTQHQPQTPPPTTQSSYGKLTPLISDITVSSIECPGVGQNLTITRAAQRQITQITLTKTEIKQFLEKVAEKANIPLMEGVFRAAVDNFVVNAVVSDMIGSRFVIKKNTPYALLER